MNFTVNTASGYPKYSGYSLLDELVNLPPLVLAKTIPFSNQPGYDDFIIQHIEAILIDSVNTPKVTCSQKEKEDVFLRLNRDINDTRLSLDLRMKLREVLHAFFGIKHINSLIELCAKDELTLMTSLMCAFNGNCSSDLFALIKEYKATLLRKLTEGSKSHRQARIAFDVYIRNQLLARLTHLDMISLDELVTAQKRNNVPGNITVQHWCSERISLLENKPDCYLM